MSAVNTEGRTPALQRVRDVQARLKALGLLSRSTAAFGFALLTGLDFGMFNDGAWLRPITAAQSALLLVIAAFAVTRERDELASRVFERISKAIVFLAVPSGIAMLTMAQKWWIALRPDLTSQLTYRGSYTVMSVTMTLAGVLLALGRGQRFARYFAAFAAHPARQTALSFVGLAVFGAFFLTFPACVRQPQNVSFVNALFMAASAACVTGLAVHVIPVEYTIYGQVLLLALVQIGALGIMVLSASLVVLTGRKLRARSSAALAEAIDAESLASLRGNILRIVLLTLCCEAVGAALIYAAFTHHPEVAMGFDVDHPKAGAGSILWAAVFHAVSAFCNAGFTLTRDNLAPFAASYDVCAVTMGLVTVGGLGFPVLSELVQHCFARTQRRRPPRLSLHTRTALTVSAGLVVVATLLLAAVEWNNTLRNESWHTRLLAALFQAVSLRTAGFNTIDFGAVSHAGLMGAVLVMFVGASPGGTGGGIKTTTFAVLLATFRAELRGREDPWLFDRRLPAATIRRAIAVTFVSAAVLTCSVFALLLCEKAEPLRLVFEAVSAFATVGFSTNLTPSLSTPGKVVIIITMLIGRIGPLTVALAASERNERERHQPPKERVLIG